MFFPGDEVVCINDSEPSQQPPNVVVLNSTYTVVRCEQRARTRPISFAPGFFAITFEWYVHLAEVPSPKGIGFFAFRFRKVERKSRATDITIFKEIVDGTRIVPLDPVAPVRKKEAV